jgi:phytanoyl-CoA hydroxylase
MTSSVLSPDQLAAWERDGFLVVPGFVGRDRCNELKAHVESMLAGIDPDRDGAVSVFSTTDQSHGQEEWFLTSGDKIRWFFEDGAVVDGRLTRPLGQAVNKLGHAMHDLDPVFDRFSRTPELAAIAADIGFVDPLLLQSMYIFKQPGIGGEVTCHCDHTFLWTEPQSVVGFWFAIEDATLENGCLWAIPGGHRIPVKSRFRRDEVGTTMFTLDEKPYPNDELVPLEVEAGTLVLLHGSLPHWSAANTSNRSRHAFTLHVIEGRADYLDDNWLQRAPELPMRGFG